MVLALLISGIGLSNNIYDISMIVDNYEEYKRNDESTQIYIIDNYRMYCTPACW